LFGFTPSHLQQCARAESFSFVSTLTAAVNLFAGGRGPEFLRPFLAGGVSIALAKPNSGVRPLCCGDPLRRLVSKCFCLGGKSDIEAVFKGKNYGVACRGGVEVVAHSLRDVMISNQDTDLALLKIDFRNAFNLVDRDAFIHTACASLPALSNWTNWCYASPSILLYDHRMVLWSTSGVQQGDPLGPLYFCFGLAPLVEEIAQLGPVYQKWYMDDGGIVGPADMLCKVWDILLQRQPGEMRVVVA
jgi:reverse transcriptase-like protein